MNLTKGNILLIIRMCGWCSKWNSLSDMTEGVIHLFIYLNSVQVPVQETFCQLTVKKKKKKYG